MDPIVFKDRQGETITQIASTEDMILSSLSEQVRMMWALGVVVHVVIQGDQTILNRNQCELVRRMGRVEPVR